MYATSTFITEALRLVTQVQLLFNDCYSELTPYTVLANSGLVSTTRTNVKATSINDNDYSCHVTAVELV